MKDSERLIMLMIHSLQTEAWSESILVDKNCKQEFKMRVKDTRNSCKLLNDFMRAYVEDEDYEVSAEISDNILKMVKLPIDKLNELTEIIHEYIDRNNKRLV